MTEILQKVLEVEAEMQRIGYWETAPVAATDDAKPYGGLSFEQWLQFEFLPSVRTAASSGDFSVVPRYRVGLAALRNYDYHSTVEIALPLVHLCQQLEELLNRRLKMRGFESSLWSSMFSQLFARSRS